MLIKFHEPREAQTSIIPTPMRNMSQVLVATMALGTSILAAASQAILAPFEISAPIPYFIAGG